MFGSKNRRILDLEEANRHLNRRLAALESSELALMGQIREMDTEIFSMTQKTSWFEMQPHFIRLQAWMDARRHRESNRIAEALIPEMQKAYRHEQKTPPPKHVFIDKDELARREYASRKTLPHGRRIDPDRD